SCRLRMVSILARPRRAGRQAVWQSRWLEEGFNPRPAPEGRAPRHVLNGPGAFGFQSSPGPGGPGALDLVGKIRGSLASFNPRPAPEGRAPRPPVCRHGPSSQFQSSPGPGGPGASVPARKLDQFVKVSILARPRRAGRLAGTVPLPETGAVSIL